MKKKRFLLTLMTAALLIASCGPAQTPADAEASNTATIQETTDVSVKDDDSAASTANNATVEDVASTEAPAEVKNDITENNLKEYPPKITLSGNHDDHFIATELCYYEGEKFFLLIAKGADLPGDLADNVALIIDKLEEKVGLPYKTEHALFGFDNSTVDYGYNPWEGFDFGKKVPIFIKIDDEGAGYISCGDSSFATIYLNSLISMDVWNSVPKYRDNPDWREDYVDYYDFAHELTHVLTLRHAVLPKIIREGCADYYAWQVINSLADVSPDLQRSREEMNNYFSYQVKDDVTASTAEQIYRNDYQDLSHAARGDEYTLGRMICSFLAETYGDSFMLDYVNAIRDAGYRFEDLAFNIELFNLQQSHLDELTDIFKDVFGENVFKDFAAYYQKQQ
ncbi:MAG: hypothetical protein IK081_14885 [Lachnospiraceae bacterium]|nr:hypothetical protein [Lachnospiraceae bacterium]